MIQANKLMLCPVCGYNLGFKPWEGSNPSDEICPSCGIQFGYDDIPEASGEEGTRDEIYVRWRQQWIDSGMTWYSHGISAPTNWNPRKQLRRIEVTVFGKKNLGLNKRTEGTGRNG